MSLPIARPFAPDTARRIKRSSLAALLTSAALLTGCSPHLNVEGLPAERSPVDVGGYRMNLLCQGTAKGATVILDAGNGETSLTWTHVQPGVARFTRVCAYDRAGYAWSEASPKPRTVPVMVGELHALLGGAGIRGPVLLVGHSLGGIIARQYATKYPAEVSGVVLVDSAFETQFRRLPASVVKATVSGLQQLKTAEQLIGMGLSAVVSMMVPLEPRLPAAVAEAERTLMLADPKQVAATRGEIEDLFDYLDVRLKDESCIHNLRYTMQFLMERRLDMPKIMSWLNENGGYCDCEVLQNIEPNWFRAFGE